MNHDVIRGAVVRSLEKHECAASILRRQGSAKKITSGFRLAGTGSRASPHRPGGWRYRAVLRRALSGRTTLDPGIRRRLTTPQKKTVDVTNSGRGPR